MKQKVLRWSLIAISIISILFLVSQVYAVTREKENSTEKIIETKKIKIPSDDTFFQNKINELDKEIAEIEKEQPKIANSLFDVTVNKKILNDSTIDLIKDKEAIEKSSILNQPLDIFYLTNIYKTYMNNKINLERINLKIKEIHDQLINLEEIEKNENKKLETLNNKRKEKEELIKELNKNENKVIEIDNEINQNIDNFKKENVIEDNSTNGISIPNNFIYPCVGQLTSEFGYRIHPISKQSVFHSGIDLGVDYNDTIIASNTGLVVFSGTYGGFGKAVIISHGNQNYTLYGHNSQLLVEKGDIVQQGQPIALAGSTGYSTGPHCHFSLWINDELVNPLNYIK